MTKREPPIQTLSTLEGTREIDFGERIRHLFSALRRRWWVVLAVAVLVLSLGLWRTLREPHLYRAMTTVRVQSVQSPISGVALAGPTTDFRVDRLISEQHVIKSTAIAERVVTQLGLRIGITTPNVRWSELFGEIPPRVDAAAQHGDYRVDFGASDYTVRFGDRTVGTALYGEVVSDGALWITVPHRVQGRNSVTFRVGSMREPASHVAGGVATRVVPQTDIIQISYVARDQILARQVANSVAETYMEYTSQIIQFGARGKSEFIATTLADQEKMLGAAQDSLKSFRISTQVSSVDSELAALSANIYTLDAELRTKVAEEEVYRTLLERMAMTDTTDTALRRLFAGSPLLASNPVIMSAYESWVSLSARRAEALLGTGLGSAPAPTSTVIVGIDNLIRGTKAELQEAATSFLNGLRQQISALRDQIANLRREIGRFPPLAAEEQRLVQNVAAMQQLFTSLQEQLQLARIAESVDAAMVRVIDPALTPTIPISPNRRRDATTAAILGVLLGIVIALALDKIDNSVKSPDDIRVGLDLTILGMIPSIATAMQAGRKTAAGDRLVTRADPKSAVAEAYRSLRTNMAFARANKGIKTIVFTSPGPADGKSTTVANLAITFAQQGQRTLLIDADLRRAVLDKTFEVPRSPGLTDVLIGEKSLTEAISATSIENLSVLGSGPFPANPSELLGSAEMRAVLEEASGLYDIILMDSPPLLAVTDAAVLSTQVDGTVLVVRLGNTAREAARRSLDSLRAVHASVMGSVLNDVTVGGGSYYGGYGYYYYAYYGSEASGNGKRTVAGRLKELVGMKGG